MVGGLLTVFALWWLYFDNDAAGQLTSRRRAFFWGYGHYLIFASGAAIGAGIAVAVDFATHDAGYHRCNQGWLLPFQWRSFSRSMWATHQRKSDPIGARLAGYAAVALILGAPFTGQPVLMIGIVLAALVALNTVVFATEES